MSNPFPVPKTMKCPYCGGVGFHGKLSDDGLAFYSHKLTVKKKVGARIHVDLITLHQFMATWEAGEWVAVPKSRGSSKMCERVELGNGHTTDWAGFNPETC